MECRPAHRVVETALMRGGTSRGPVMRARDIPGDPSERDPFVTRLVGGKAPQTDGLGGGNPTTSKVVVVSEPVSTADGVSIDYAVGNIVVGHDSVDWSGTCGNMTATVPVFAFEEGLVSVEGGTRLRLRNLSTGGLIETTMTALDAHRRGEEVVVRTAYLNPCGAVLQTTLPTGNARDQLKVDGRSYDATVVDITHPYVFLRYNEVVGAGDLSDPAVVALIERIRGEACVRMGVTDTPEAALQASPAIPRLVLLHDDPSRQEPALRVTAVSMGQVIASVPVTAAMCLAGSRFVEGSLTEAFTRHLGETAELTLVSKGARMNAAVELDSARAIRSTSVERTVRTIMKGTAWC